MGWFRKKEPKPPKHECSMLWDDPYMQEYTESYYDEYDYMDMFSVPKKRKVKRLSQKGTCTDCGLVQIRKV